MGEETLHDSYKPKDGTRNKNYNAKSLRTENKMPVLINMESALFSLIQMRAKKEERSLDNFVCALLTKAIIGSLIDEPYIRENEIIKFKNSLTESDKTIFFPEVPKGAKQIPLAQGFYCIVDEEDYERLSKYRWGMKISTRGAYVVRNATKKEVESGLVDHRGVRMHRQILDFPILHVDHKNGNGLDNRKANLRLCTNVQNQGNRPKQRPDIHKKASKYRGVTWSKERNKWIAQITKNRKHCFLGYYENEDEAALRYNEEAIKHFGEFATLNIIEKRGINDNRM